MCSGCLAGKNEYSASITGALLRGDVSGANMGYVLSHCGGSTHFNKVPKFKKAPTPLGLIPKFRCFFYWKASPII